MNILKKKLIVEFNDFDFYYNKFRIYEKIIIFIKNKFRINNLFNAFVNNFIFYKYNK